MQPTTFSPTTEEIQHALPSAIIEQQIASGGQKVVFKAQFAPFGKIALKLVKPSPNSKERTLRELSVASRVSGPHFATIHKFGGVKIENEDVIYIIEEFLDGETLRSKLQREKRLDVQETIRIGRQLLEALIEVENAGLVHRDIKPENIMILPNGRIVLLDFGIARHLDMPSLTADIALFGPLTPGYAAPEQVKNEKRKISNRTDLFAWAIVMYECVSGQNPFTIGCAHQGESLQKTLTLNPPTLSSLGIDSKFSDLIQDCLKKAIHRRPPSAKIVLDLLTGIGGG